MVRWFTGGNSLVVYLPVLIYLVGSLLVLRYVILRRAFPFLGGAVMFRGRGFLKKCMSVQPILAHA